MYRNINVYCNQCGRKLMQKHGVLYEDCLRINKQWGYFSTQDGKEDQFCLCERCYKELVKGFKIPVKRTNTKELL